MKTFDDLVSNLFSQIDRLDSEEISKDKERLAMEIDKTKAKVDVAKTIFDIGKLQLDAARTKAEWNLKHYEVPEIMALDEPVECQQKQY